MKETGVKKKKLLIRFPRSHGKRGGREQTFPNCLVLTVGGLCELSDGDNQPQVTQMLEAQSVRTDIQVSNSARRASGSALQTSCRSSAHSISPSAHSKVFCLFTSPAVPCSSSHLEAPFSPVPVQAVSFVSSFVTLTTMWIWDLEMECSTLDFTFMYVRDAY